MDFLIGVIIGFVGHEIAWRNYVSKLNNQHLQTATKHDRTVADNSRSTTAYSKPESKKYYTYNEVAKQVVPNDDVVINPDIDDNASQEANIHVAALTVGAAIEYMAQGMDVSEILFDPETQEFFWATDYAHIDNIDAIIGPRNREVILAQSAANARGWVQQQYYHDDREDTVIKITSQFDIPNVMSK